MYKLTGLNDVDGNAVKRGDVLQVGESLYKVVWNDESCGFKLEDKNGLRISMRQLKHQKYRIIKIK